MQSCRVPEKKEKRKKVEFLILSIPSCLRWTNHMADIALDWEETG
jgi:hypothetical protein